ncbi:hypothetical protein, partial [Vibrio parahaemolyticus]|uniref:hypothetical protein n=1 Tax=Vibrio parahaemolyticus TaxID=670 RepID=UPI001E31E4A8
RLYGGFFVPKIHYFSIFNKYPHAKMYFWYFTTSELMVHFIHLHGKVLFNKLSHERLTMFAIAAC